MQPPDLSTLPRWLLQETLANNGRYLSQLSREHVPRLRAQALWLLDLPDERVQRFGESGPEATAGALPLFDGFAQTLDQAPRRAGWCLPTSSVRTVVPERRLGMDGWAVKLHVPDSMRDRLSKRMGSKQINAADAAMATVFSALLKRVAVDASPFLGVVEEPCSMVATLGAGEVGAIFRRLPDAGDLVPAFSLYSRPRAPLEGNVPVGVDVVRAGLAASAATADILDRCLALFVEPLLDIFFSLASRGVTMQMHAQNLLFEMAPDLRSTRRVWIRDMHGLNYASEYRTSRGLDDLPPVIIEEVPGASDELLRRWLERDGKRRRMFDERFMFGHSYDMHVSAFWHQLLVGFWRAGLLRFGEIGLLQRAIQQRAAAAAEHYDFDTALLLPRFPARQGVLAALVRGIARHPPFRPRA